MSHIPLSRCPTCGRPLDLAVGTRPGVRAPRPEDCVICGYCGVFLKLQGDMTARRATAEEEAFLRQRHSLGLAMAETEAERIRGIGRLIERLRNL